MAAASIFEDEQTGDQHSPKARGATESAYPLNGAASAATPRHRMWEGAAASFNQLPCTSTNRTWECETTCLPADHLPVPAASLWPESTSVQEDAEGFLILPERYLWPVSWVWRRTSAYPAYNKCLVTERCSAGKRSVIQLAFSSEPSLLDANVLLGSNS
jgi:hypothetical protein